MRQNVLRWLAPLVFVAWGGAVAQEEVQVHCSSAECRRGSYSNKMVKKMLAKTKHYDEKMLRVQEYQARAEAPTGPSPCVNGLAGGFFPCKNINLLSVTSPKAAGSGAMGSDVWGWTDPQTNREYALSTFMDGTSIIDVTDPQNPQALFWIPSDTVQQKYWRDVKVYKNTAYIVADVDGHRMQVFDLERVRQKTSVGLETVQPDFLYAEFGKGHNIFITEETGYGYIVGSDTCSSGIHVVDLNADRLRPTFVGCWSSNLYVHDIQCLVYDGPDTEFTGKEICLGFDENYMSVLDLSVKTVTNQASKELGSIVELSRVTYPGLAYTHQGWLTKDRKFLLLDDEKDEETQPTKTKTYIFNMESLRKPQYVSTYSGSVVAIDHNLYIQDGYAYLSNYASGLRVVDIAGLYGGSALEEVAVFDTFPENDGVVFDGIWSSYIYFKSGNLALNSQEYGLIMVKLGSLCVNKGGLKSAAGDNFDCEALRNQCSWSGVVRERCKGVCAQCNSERMPANCEDSSPSGFALPSQPSVKQECSALLNFCSRSDVRMACPKTCNACGATDTLEGFQFDPKALSILSDDSIPTPGGVTNTDTPSPSNSGGDSNTGLIIGVIAGVAVLGIGAFVARNRSQQMRQTSNSKELGIGGMPQSYQYGYPQQPPPQQYQNGQQYNGSQQYASNNRQFGY